MGVHNVTTTNLGPLTTHFSKPPRCDSTYLSAHQNMELGDRCSTSLDLDQPSWRTECYPNGEGLMEFYKDYMPLRSTAMLAVHSPGLACPSGWSAAYSFVKNSTSDYYDSDSGSSYYLHDEIAYEAIGLSEALVVCCPKSFSLDTEVTSIDKCFSQWTSGSVVTLSTWANDCSPGLKTSTLGYDTQYLVAERVVLVVPSGSALLPPAETGKTSSNSAGSGSGTDSDSNSDSNSHSDSNSDSSGGLSKTSKIAIGVAIPVAFLILLAVGVFFILRHRRNHRAAAQTNTAPTQPPFASHLAEKDGTSTQRATELAGHNNTRSTGAGELEAAAMQRQQWPSHGAYELDAVAPTNMHELQGSRYNYAELGDAALPRADPDTKPPLGTAAAAQNTTAEVDEHMSHSPNYVPPLSNDSQLSQSATGLQQQQQQQQQPGDASDSKEAIRRQLAELREQQTLLERKLAPKE